MKNKKIKKYIALIMLANCSFVLAQINKIETPKPEPINPIVSPNSFDEGACAKDYGMGFTMIRKYYDTQVILTTEKK